MSALINPYRYDEPTERCSQLCSEVSFLLKQDFFGVEHGKLHAQVEDIPTKTTVFSENLAFVRVGMWSAVDDSVHIYFGRKKVDTSLFHR
jgi:hypothetical protein